MQGELADYAKQVDSVFEVTKMDTTQKVAQGNTVVVLVKWAGSGRATGKVRNWSGRVPAAEGRKAGLLLQKPGRQDSCCRRGEGRIPAAEGRKAGFLLQRGGRTGREQAEVNIALG